MIGKLDHTLFLIQYLALQTAKILTDKVGYNEKVKPAVAAIQQALRTADPGQIAAAYSTNQPDIIEWMVTNEIALPTETYLRQSGLLDQDRRTEDAKIQDLRSPEKTANTLAMVPGDIRMCKALR